jgi:hypothetical protein
MAQIFVAGHGAKIGDLARRQHLFERRELDAGVQQLRVKVRMSISDDGLQAREQDVCMAKLRYARPRPSVEGVFRAARTGGSDRARRSPRRRRSGEGERCRQPSHSPDDRNALFGRGSGLLH